MPAIDEKDKVSETAEKKPDENNTIAEIKEESTEASKEKIETKAETKDAGEATEAAETTRPFIEYNREPSELKKNKKLERTNSSLGNNLPKKAKVTSPTYYSLIENFQSGKYKDILQSISDNVGSLRAKITKDAQKKAEEDAKRAFGVDEAMKKFNGSNSTSADDMKKAANLLTLELERKLSAATDPSKIIPLLEENKMALTNSRRHKIEFNEGGQVPRAIMIPALLKKSISIIESNAARYGKKEPEENVNVVNFDSTTTEKTVEDETTYKVEVSTEEQAPKKEEKKKKRPKWEGAFGNLKKVSEKSSEPVSHREPAMVEAPSSSKISKGELRERRTLAEAGESLNEIEKLKRTVGAGVPFSSGLAQRERELKKVIGDITGVVIPEAVNVVVNKNTDFQNDLDRLLGVKAEPTREEHDKNQRKYEAYFNDPDFVKQIERQKLEGVLYDMNTPQFAESIDRAERIDNERRAMLSRQVNMEILEDTFDDVKVNAVEHKEEPVTEAPVVVAPEPVTEVVTEPVTEASSAVVMEVKQEPVEAATTVVTEVKAEPTTEPKKPKKTKPNFVSDFRKYGLFSSKKIKRMKATNILPMEARSFAKQLYDQNMQAEILESAHVEAERLNTLNKLIDGAKEQATLLHKANLSEANKAAQENMIREGALDEAKRLFELNKLIDGAHEQARLLYEKEKESSNFDEEMKSSALVEAKRLKAINDLLDSAREQAKMIYDADLHQMIVTSAKEEADKLNKINKLLDGAREQAQMLYNNNQAISANQAQSIEEARLREMEERKAAIERPEYEVTDARSRYAQIVDYSKPIKLLSNKFGNFRTNTSMKYVTPTSYKDTLISLRDELNDFEDDSTDASGAQLKMVA